MTSMVAVVLTAIVLMAVPAFTDDLTVGGSSGWTQNVDYKTWASGQTFKSGDNLVFQYTSVHTVDVVNKADYDACSSSNSLKSYTDGNTKIALTGPGTQYFICGTPGHCNAGMKVAVTVAGSTPTPTTPSTPTPTPSTPTPSTPTPSTPTPSNKSSAAVTGGNAMLIGGLVVGVVALMG